MDAERQRELKKRDRVCGEEIDKLKKAIDVQIEVHDQIKEHYNTEGQKLAVNFTKRTNKKMEWFAEPFNLRDQA